MSITGFIDRRLYHYAPVKNQYQIPMPTKCRILKKDSGNPEKKMIQLEGSDRILRIRKDYIKKSEEDCKEICIRLIQAQIDNKKKRLEELTFHMKKLDPTYGRKTKRLPDTNAIQENNWIYLDDSYPETNDVSEQDGRILATDGIDTYQRIYDPKTRTFRYLTYPQGIRHVTIEDPHVIAWQPMPKAARQNESPDKSCEKQQGMIK